VKQKCNGWNNLPYVEYCGIDMFIIGRRYIYIYNIIYLLNSSKLRIASWFCCKYNFFEQITKYNIKTEIISPSRVIEKNIVNKYPVST